METLLNPFEEGENLNIRVPFEGRSIPVLITYEAMSDHYGASHAEGQPWSMVQAYVANATEIDARVLTKAVPGAIYTRQNPLRIFTADF